MSDPGRPTLADVAAEARCSPSTASYAFSGSRRISEATRARVLAAADRLGYTGPNPTARSLRTGTTGVVGVVVGDRLRQSFRDPLQIRIMDGLATELGEHGLGLLLIPVEAGAGEHELPPVLRTAAMDVAVVHGCPPDDAALLALRARGVAVVAIEGPAGQGLPVVGIDDRAGMVAIVEHLRALGHTRIGVVSLPLGDHRRHGPLEPADWDRAVYPSTARRLAALREAGVRPVATVETAGSLVEEGQTAGRELLTGSQRPTAVIALSDFLASGVVLAARELGLEIPAQVSIVGFDGLDLPWLAPDTLTTVAQPLGRKGRLAARAAVAVMAGEHPRDMVLPVEFRAGTTTGPAA